MKTIDYSKVFEVLPQVTGLPLRRYGRYWNGACYLDGTPHHRRNKLSCRIAPRGDGIQLLEAGGDCMDLWKWLLEFGGCKSHYEVACRLRVETNGVLAPKQAILPTFSPVPMDLYVESLKRGKKDSFWRFLTSMWSDVEVEEVLELYHVCSTRLRDGRWATQFWYVDKELRPLHDKIILYKDDGHRDKSFGGSREFKTADGYGLRCLFGEDQLARRESGQRVFVVESEKTAILMKLRYPRHIYLASGGVNNLRSVDSDWELLPDFDSAGHKWLDRWGSQCVEWWKWYMDAEVGNDMGDIVVKERKSPL